MTNIGFRILPVTKRPDKNLIKQYENVVTPHISDNMNRMNAVSSYLRQYHKEGKLVGTAFTIKTRPGDNLMVHKAIDMAEPGDVIVVDAGGDMTNAIIGEIMMNIAKKNGLAGFVVDGAIRDVAAISNDIFPVFARGVTHRGPYKDGPGEINVPVSIGGMIINPGDIIVGDEDGLVAVPLEEAENILRYIKTQQQLEEEILQSIQEGTINREWIDERLKQKGCEVLITTSYI
ncbi:RraA family protein [Peribacillus cavernae]|uniref:Putative 4-hydroxy-4-methyl-2-oxoglutarate aldolase n=1 Tax=Peribacillus cavernae TaxID=1674310 RepID=A0A3S0UJ75_9BACI|nr:RraA family protein [Peribacillus cavernae]MDQ0221115.1 RraA family protein [Peribacillus cavernae]RUQ32844.1 RraA family protein [Peribacillus cavernae]